MHFIDDFVLPLAARKGLGPLCHLLYIAPFIE